MSESFDLVGTHPNKKIRILRSDSQKSQKNQAPGSKGDKPPP